MANTNNWFIYRCWSFYRGCFEKLPWKLQKFLIKKWQSKTWFDVIKNVKKYTCFLLRTYLKMFIYYEFSNNYTRTTIPKQWALANLFWVCYLYIYLFVCLFCLFVFVFFCGGRGGGEGIINISIIKYKHELTIMKQRKASKY